MDKADAAMETVKQIIRKHFGCDADEIGKKTNATNNSVYCFTVGGDCFFLKLYRSKDWPEEGKIPFVYQRLSQNNLPCPGLIAYSRDVETYPNGYLIERQVQGTAADKIQLDRDQEIGLYVKLAEQLSSVHGIGIKNYGYIGRGVACYDSLIDFFEDEFDRFDTALKDAVSEIQLKKLKEKVLHTIHKFEDLPSVLCHGDLSKKNIILRDNGEISLIDWDDAMALNWMADVSRLTFWMKQSYNEHEYTLFRNAFLENYHTSQRKADFDVFENAYHIYAALDFLLFSKKVESMVMESYFKSYLDVICQDTERVEKLTTRSNLMIETTRLIIRPFRKEDADALYRIKTDPQVMEFCPDFLDVDAQREDMDSYINDFQRIEDTGDNDTWRCYAIENRESGLVMGALTFSKQNMLHEYELGWMMIGEYTGKGYASEAAEAFAEDFCRTHGIDYMVVVMDIDNPASRRTAEKSGFRLFEKRTVYDYHYNRYCDDYFYFRRYWSGCTLKDR